MPHAEGGALRLLGYRPGLRRSFLLLATLTMTYLIVAGWILWSGWARFMASAPIQPEAVALYVALVVLTAFPLALRFLYSNFIVRQLEEATQVLGSARDAARTMARTKAEFLATMSHEIRTPLHAVIGFSELLGNASTPSQQREYVAAIRESSAHLLLIINDVLDYSKIEAGHVEFEERPVEVRSLVEGSLQSIMPAAAARGLRVTSDVADGVPETLHSDATRLRQVLLNLLSNAAKFTERGSIRLSVRALRQRGGDYLVTFAVRDTGIGIAPEDQRLLFKAFSQLDPSSTRSRGGTGLGLAISRRLCNLMGGDLTVESRLGRGSTFTASIRATVAPAAGPAAAAPQALRGLRMLVVADSDGRAAIARHTQGWGMAVRATGNPDTAMAWIEAGDPFDVAVLGGHGSRLDGQRLAERLHAAGRDSLPLVLATPGRRHTSGPGQPFAAHVRRPITSDALRAALMAAVGRPRRMRPQASRPHPGLRVLLVEDNAMNEKLAVRVLQDLGYTPDVARNGQEAVDAALAKRYDVVLMDVQMPVMDGLGATRTIHRRLAGTRRPLIVGLSANALPGDREQCLRAGMDEYIPKPMDQGRLAAILAGARERGRPAKAALRHSP